MQHASIHTDSIFLQSLTFPILGVAFESVKYQAIFMIIRSAILLNQSFLIMTTRIMKYFAITTIKNMTNIQLAFSNLQITGETSAAVLIAG